MKFADLQLNFRLLQTLAIEFQTVAIEFQILAIEFQTPAIEFQNNYLPITFQRQIKCVFSEHTLERCLLFQLFNLYVDIFLCE